MEIIDYRFLVMIWIGNGNNRIKIGILRYMQSKKWLWKYPMKNCSSSICMVTQEKNLVLCTAVSTAEIHTHQENSLIFYLKSLKTSTTTTAISRHLNISKGLQELRFGNNWNWLTLIRCKLLSVVLPKVRYTSVSKIIRQSGKSCAK